MPSGGIHLCVAKEVARRLNYDANIEYYIGSVAPDSWRNSNSLKTATHFIEYDDSNDYDYISFIDKYYNVLDDGFVFGYLVHLITDQYWYNNNFITLPYDEVIRNTSLIIKKYKIEPLYMPDKFNNPIDELETSGIPITLEYLNGVNYLDDVSDNLSNQLIKQIEETTDFVIKELKRVFRQRKR